jgi:uncharacterized membrane protein
VKRLLILAIVLRVLVAGLLFHPDIKTYNFQASFMRKGVFNIYSYLVNNKSTLPLKDEFVYFPLTYFTVGIYQIVASPILGSGFNAWLANADSNAIVMDPNIFRYLLVMKLPYLVLDIVIAFLLLHYFTDKTKAKMAFIFWLFNPFTIFLIYAYSNIDIYPVALSLIALLLAEKGRTKSAAVLLGLAAGFKLYPLLFMPFLALTGKNLKDKIFLAAVPILIFVGISLPFLSPAFINSTLISGLTTRILYPNLGIGFNESLIVGILTMVGLFFYSALVDKKMDMVSYWSVLFLVVLSFAHFHIAWLLWVAPFLVILVVRKPQLAWTILALSAFAFVIPLLYEDRFMTVGLLRPYSLYFDLLPTPFAVVQKFFDPYSLQSIFHSALAGVTLVVSYIAIKKEI